MRFTLVPAITLLSLSAFAQPAHTLELISLEVKDATLRGTLTVPSGGGKSPVALIIVGSGPTDQNGNSLGTVVQPNSYKLLSEALAAKGIATLRFDKRGIASSQTSLSENQLRFTDFANDAVALITTLKKDSRFSGVYIIGHSEGSLLGMLAAQKIAVMGYISLAGPGRPADQILLEQLTPQVTPAMLLEIKRVLESLKAGKPILSKDIKLPAALVSALFRDSVQPYLISWFKYDPSVEIKKLECRVAVLQGTTDIQVGASEAKLLAQNPVLLEGMNHVLKLATLEPASQNLAYTDGKLPIAPSLIDAIAAFVRP